MSTSNIVFDSIEFDDRFLSKIDAEVKCKTKINSRKDSTLIFSDPGNNSKCIQVKTETPNTSNFKKMQYYDLPLSINDLTETTNKFNAIKSKDYSTASNDFVAQKQDVEDLSSAAFTSCLSPIMATLASSHGVVISSTPLRSSEFCKSLKLKKEDTHHPTSVTEENFKKGDYDYLEFDLFEDWDNLATDYKISQRNNFIRASPKVNMVKHSEEKELIEDNFNDSIDLLTGEVAKVEKNSSENLFAGSFNLSQLESFEKKNQSIFLGNNDSIDKSKSVIKDSYKLSNNKKKKPLAAHRLNFEKEKATSLLNDKSLFKNYDLENENANFDLDDSFDEILQLGLISRLKTNKLDSFHLKKKSTSKSAQNDININRSITPVRDIETLDRSFLIPKKRGKCFKIQESDSEIDNVMDSDSSEPCEQKRQKMQLMEKSGREFLDSEAEVSQQEEVSSDETDIEEDNYEKSFVDDESYFSQNGENDMIVKYLESVKTLNNQPGTFKIPKPKPYIPEDIYSQMPLEDSVDYKIDSFCVHDIEYEEKELSDLEIAEQVLEIERRNRKRKFKSHSKKKK